MMLPSDLTYGKVVGRAVVAAPDGPDADQLPDGKSVTGKAVFKPVNPERVTDSYSALVVIPTYEAEFYRPLVPDLELHPPGTLLDAQGQAGIWLPVGVYDVTLDIRESSARTGRIEVTAAHTEASPLDLFKAIPPIPHNVIINQLTVPSGGGPDETLVRDTNGDLTWSSVASDAAQDAQAALAAIPSEVTTELAAQVPPAVTAELATQGIAVDTRAGTKVTVGGVVVHYDSGWRDITSLLLNGWIATSLRVKRENDTVHVQAIFLDGNSSTNELLVELPAGFRLGNGMRGEAGVLHYSSASTTTTPWSIRGGTSGSRVRATSVPSRNDLSGTLSFPTTDPLPTTLPGIPA